MGCDIHAMLEMWHEPRGEGSGRWVSGGRIWIGRDYHLFARLADVRNYDGLKPISKPRFTDAELLKLEDDWWGVCSEDFCALIQKWGVDAHSHSWVTIGELATVDRDLATRCTLACEGHEHDPGRARLAFFFDN